MTQKESSRQTQSPLADAQNSIEKLQHAVHQMESHPSSKMAQQADNVLVKANRAMDAADSDLNQKAVHEADEQLQDAKNTLWHEEENLKD